MRKRIWLVAGGSLLAATIGLLGSSAAAANASTGSPVVGYTYINDNTVGVNTVAGFDRHADGSLTPIPGSPFAVGGAGLGSGLASQGAIEATPDGRYLLAVDAGSNQVSVLCVTAGGVPVPVGQPVSSGGIKPVSVAISPSGLVYVANSGNGGSGYSGFRLLPGGRLIPVPGSTVSVPDGSGLGDVFFNSLGDHLVGTRTGTSLIARRPGLPVHRAGPGPTRRGVLAIAPLPAVREQRAQRRRPGHGVRLPGQLLRRALPDRVIALPRRADRAVLGGDQP
jgi:6-phosphogluconolactonase